MRFSELIHGSVPRVRKAPKLLGPGGLVPSAPNDERKTLPLRRRDDGRATTTAGVYKDGVPKGV